MNRTLLCTLLLTRSLAGFTTFPAVDSFTDEIKSCFERDGFVVIEGFLTPEQCERLKQESQKIVDDFDPERYCTIFSADANADQHKRGEYFFDSADKISCFLEDKAVKDGVLIVDKNRAVNKIGHALHDKNPVFKEISFCPKIAHYAHDIGIIDPIIAQSMVIFKYAKIGGAVGPHQDATFLYTEPLSVVGFWFALDDATQENACLWVAPGTHKGPLSCRFVSDDQHRTSFINGSLKECALPDDRFVPVEVPKGSLVIFHGKLIHKSEQNYSPHDRNAYTFHVISGATHYPADNWLQRNDFPRL